MNKLYVVLRKLVSL